MQFTRWSDSLHDSDLVFGPRLESSRPGNHSAAYYPVRRASKPIRFYSPLVKCKFVPTEEYNSIDVSVYAPGSGVQDELDDFIDRLKATEEAVIKWTITNAADIFAAYEPIPDEDAIRSKFRSSVVDRIECLKFKLMPEHGCVYFGNDGIVMTKETARDQLCVSNNLPNMRIGAEIKSVGIYNPKRPRNGKCEFEGKIEMRLFALQIRLLQPDAADDTAVNNDTCMMPSEMDITS